MKKRRKSKKARKPNPYAAASTIRAADGTTRLYLNYDFPSVRPSCTPYPKHKAVCQACGHGYAHLLLTSSTTCRECQWEACVEWGLKVQDETGMNLGWMRPDVMKQPHRVSRVDLPDAKPAKENLVRKSA